MNDVELLRRYRDTGSEEAFRELVHRHLAMVYSVALRQVRNADWADEAAHAVFIALARKASSLSDRTVLVGWLYRATRYAAAKILRDEQRRSRQEEEAATVNLNNRSSDQDAISWEKLSPLVLEALDSLGRKDRDAILMRFIENRTFAEVAAALGTTEAAAKMRTGRAMEKLRKLVGKRASDVTMTMLTADLGAFFLCSTPTGLATSVAAAALGPAVASASAVSLAGHLIGAFTWAKVKIAAACIGIAMAGGAVAVLIALRSDQNADLRARPDDIAARNGWVVVGRNVWPEIHRGQRAIHFDRQKGPGVAWREGFVFSEGAIDADIAAFTGHIGLAFWVRDSKHYSAVYFRPQNRPTDPVNGAHGVQYAALPDYGWERLRREKPGIYENAASLPEPDSGIWFHVHLEISRTQVRVFVNNSKEPCLIVNDVLTHDTSGSIGFFMGSDSLAIISNLKVQPAHRN
jgi:RNA polymerase sigma factor (sigma-70 family)